MVRGNVAKLALTGFLLAFAIVGVQARQESEIGTVASIALSSLPVQGHETYQRIRQGGPFPYEKDGVVFSNRERLLPANKRGYYHEYTVKTPGSRDRGAQRIVCGGPVQEPDVCYFTGDHYASFRKIVP
jgi:ribonuclease T1